MDSDGWTQRELVRRVGKSQPWLVKILSGENALRLDDLDPVAKAIGVPPAELIREGENDLVEATPTELRLLRSFRALSLDMRTHVVSLVANLHAPTETKRPAVPPSDAALVARIGAIAADLAVLHDQLAGMQTTAHERKSSGKRTNVS